MKKRTRMFIWIFLIIIIICSYFGYIKYKEITSIHNAFNNQKRMEEAAKKYEEIRAKQQQEKQEVKENVQIQFNENRINILLLGFDKDESREDKYRIFRPDGIILVSLNLEKDTVDMISFPRDSRVWIAHRPGKDKINASFYYGHDLGGGKTADEKEDLGYQYCVDTVSEFLGDIYINNYVAIDMEALVKIINAMGGVKIEVKEDMYEEKYDRLEIKAGTHVLNGKKFLFYVRDRDHINEKDVDRAKRQQEAFTIAFNQFKTSNKISMIPELLNTLKENIHTNLTLTQMTSLALYGQKINIDNINKYIVNGEYQYINNYIYYIPNENDRIQLIKDVFDFDFTPRR